MEGGSAPFRFTVSKTPNLTEYGMISVTPPHFQSCSENRTNRTGCFAAPPVRKWGARELHLHSRQLHRQNKRAKARVVECSEGEDSTRALARLLAQRIKILNANSDAAVYDSILFRKTNKLIRGQAASRKETKIRRKPKRLWRPGRLDVADDRGVPPSCSLPGSA